MLAGVYYWLPQFTAAALASAARPARLLADLRRLQPHLPGDAPDRAAGHAAPGLHLCAGPRLGLAQPDLLDRLLRDGLRLRRRADRCRAGDRLRAPVIAQSLAREHARMGPADAGPELQPGEPAACGVARAARQAAPAGAEPGARRGLSRPHPRRPARDDGRSRRLRPGQRDRHPARQFLAAHRHGRSDGPVLPVPCCSASTGWRRSRSWP